MVDNERNGRLQKTKWYYGMIVIVDSNIIFSALLSKNNHYAQKIFKAEHTYTTVNFLISEIFDHKEKIIKFSKLNGGEFKEHFELLFAHLRLIPDTDISFHNYYSAYQIVSKADVKNIAFVALAMELRAQLWTNDKPIRQAILEYGGVELFVP